ncbi:MAG TPA: helix-turn-helix domain-containing protein [Candidatus Borkfalkia excrementipullorum]|nr:helix-turn-helix domain-containing protein [Candidatus Borkfalkia excrementipullorum]
MLIDDIKLRLRAAIKDSGLSQKEIAKRVGVHPSTVSKYVRMEKYPSIDTFAELCRAIGASSDRILGLDNSLE